jgi:Spy/CpxP family protein refolding chaperone
MTFPVPPSDPQQPPAGDPSTAPTTTTAPPAAVPPATATPSADPAGAKPEEPLGAPGLKALQDERDKNKALKQQLNDLSPLLDFVQQLRSGKGVPESQQTDVEKLEARIAAAEKTAEDERLMRIRTEVASEKKLTPQQAGRLQGTTREELSADADALIALFPQQATGGGQPGTPRPDLSQGQRGPVELDALIAEAEKNKDIPRAIALKRQRAAAHRT